MDYLFYLLSACHRVTVFLSLFLLQGAERHTNGRKAMTTEEITWGNRDLAHGVRIFANSFCRSEECAPAFSKFPLYCAESNAEYEILVCYATSTSYL